MGTVRKIPTGFTISYQKYIVEAYIEWIGDHYHVYISVMHEDGKPATSLTVNDFKVGTIGHHLWGTFEITEFTDDGSAHGIYFLRIEGAFTPDRINSVEVSHTEQSGKSQVHYRGQCLAAMQTKVAP